jgi:hypothetical protein
MTGSLPLRWRVHAAVSTAVIPPLLRFLSFARLVTWLGREAHAPAAPFGTVEAAAIAQWVDRLMYAAPRPWRYTCLSRAAVLYHLFRRARHPVELWVGVRRDDAGALAAHAWLVREGQPYLESEPDLPAQHATIAKFPER